jgi:hypothetical protein
MPLAIWTGEESGSPQVSASKRRYASVSPWKGSTYVEVGTWRYVSELSLDLGINDSAAIDVGIQNMYILPIAVFWPIS